MKRLIALIGAVATAFGLYADPVEYYANSFETTTEGLSQDGTTWSAATPWSTELTDAFKVEAYGQGEPGVYSDVAARRTTMFQAQDTNLNVLKLETGTNTLDLAIGDVTVDPGKFYFDQLVKFTGFEEEPTFAADTKIAVWMSAIETEGTPAVPAQGEPQIENELGEMVDNPDYVPPVPPSDDYIQGETNLYVQVGTGTAARKVQIKGSFATETWYRITIKSLGNVIDPSTGSQQAGFLVFINGESAEIVDDNKEYYGVPGNLLPTAKDYYDKGLLFTAIDTTSVTLAKVGYQGIGAIDDVILTSTSPDFDTSDEIEIEIGSLALEGAKVIKIGDVTITDQTSIKVKPGDILVSYAANGPYIVRNGDGVKWTVAADGTLVMDTAATIDVIEAAAKITRSGVDTYYAADELDAAIAQVQDGDTVTFLKQCTLLNSAYTIPEGTTIAVAAGGVWTVNVPANGRLINTFGVESDKNITITLVGNRAGLVLSGTIYSGLKSATLLTVDGAVQLGGALTIGAVKEGAQSDEGAVLTVASIRITGTNKITLVGKGKVISGTALTAENFTNAADDLDISYNEETKTYTAQLKGEAPTPAETGFMVIIAGETEGDVYPTLAAAVEAATAGATIKLLSNETAVAGKCEITKNITLDLNGKKLARDNNAATLFVIKDATLTINGATAGSTLVGRLNVGDSVYNGGVRTAHWDGALVINGGTYSVGNGQTVIHVNGDCLDAAVTINNATLTSPTDNGVQFNGKGTFAINNSTINGATAVYMKAGTLTIDKDSKINATATTWTAPVANHNGSNPTGDAIVMDSTTGYQGAISLTVADGAQVTKVAEGAATIRETITDATESTTVKIDAPTIGGIALTEAFLAKVANGSAQLPGYVATIGTVPYQTLAAAVAAAKNDDTIKVIADCTVADAILVDKAVTLDATGKTVTCAAMYPFFVKGGDLTITDGTFTQNVVDGIILWAKDGGKITVNGGDFSAIPDGEIAYVSTADALIKIYGGKFVMANKADGSKGDVLNVAQTLGLNKTDYIQVYGGSFSKDPAEGDDALGPTFVANGYASVKQDNGLWKVGAAIIATFKVDDAIVKAETNIVAFTPVAPTNPSKEGYTFTGWTPAVDEISKSTVFVAQFKAEETKVDPEQPIPVPAEKTPEQVAEQMNTKGIANYLKVPTVVTDAAAYTAMFAAKADGNTVIIALKPTVEAEIKAELANTATSGSMLNPDATTSEVTITARPGLFYGIKAVGDVTTIGTANGQNWVQASGDTVNVVRPTVSGNAAFFQAVCSPKAPPANN